MKLMKFLLIVGLLTVVSCSKNSKTKGEHKHNTKNITNKDFLKCKRCGKMGHKTSNCWDDSKNEDKHPSFHKKLKTTKNKSNKEITFSVDQFNYLVNELPFLNQKKNKKICTVTFCQSSNMEEEVEENYMVT